MNQSPRRILARILLAVVLAAKASTSAAVTQVEYVDELNFYNTDLHLVLLALEERTGYPFVEDIPVQGKITVHVAERTPIAEVLDQILRGLNLSWRLEKGVYHVEMKVPVKGAPLGRGLVARTYELQVVPADEAVEAILRLLSEYGKVSADTGLNTVMVTDVAEVHASVRTLLDSLDVEGRQTAQINVQIKILEIRRTDSSRYRSAISWNKYDAFESLSSKFMNPLPSFSGNIPGSISDAFSFTVGHWGIDQVVAHYTASVTTDQLNVLAEPDITVPNGQDAEIFVGERIAQEWGGLSPWEDIGIKLWVRPKLVGTDGMIEIQVKPEISERTGLVSPFFQKDFPGIDYLKNQVVDTTVQVISGGTIRIAGLTFVEDSVIEKKIPVLGDLPLIGALFKDTNKSRTKQEIVILVSPRLLERIPPRCATTAGISALLANLVVGSTDVMLDWSEDVPFDNIGVIRYHVYRDTRPIVATAGLIPLSREVRGDLTSWVDYTSKRRGVTYYYAVTGIDGAGNEQAVSNSPSVTIPRR